MIVRLRYIGKPAHFLVKDKVYYFDYKQASNLRITLTLMSDPECVVILRNLEDLLDRFKILTLKKELKNA